MLPFDILKFNNDWLENGINPKRVALLRFGRQESKNFGLRRRGGGVLVTLVVLAKSLQNLSSEAARSLRAAALLQLGGSIPVGSSSPSSIPQREGMGRGGFGIGPSGPQGPVHASSRCVVNEPTTQASSRWVGSTAFQTKLLSNTTSEALSGCTSTCFSPFLLP